MADQMPVYELILKNIRKGELPESFSLPSDPEDQSSIFADGAMDGICIYHSVRTEMGPEEKKLMIKALNHAAAADYADADKTFTALGKKYRAIRAIDDLQSYIIKHTNKMPIGNVYHTALNLILHSSDKEAVKFGLSMLELIPVKDESVKEIIRRIGLSDEFTIFAIWIMRKWENGNAEIFNLAEKVHSWGRIHCVDRLEPETPEIREWLFKEGIDNHVLPAYSALTVWEKADVKNRLNGTVTAGDIKCLGKIFAALTDEGPTLNISQIDDAEQMINRFLSLAEEFELDAEDYDSIAVIRDWAGYSEEDVEEEKSEARSLITERCNELLSGEECEDAVAEAVRNGKGFRLAYDLGIEFEEELLDFMRKDFREYCFLCPLLMETDDYIEQVTDLFRNNLPLSSMRKDPSGSIGAGEEFADYHRLEAVLRGLDKHPYEGEDLVISGLWSPVIRTRNTALAVIAEWTKILEKPLSSVSEEIFNELRDMREKETEDSLKRTEQRLIDGVILDDEGEQDE